MSVSTRRNTIIFHAALIASALSFAVGAALCRPASLCAEELDLTRISIEELMSIKVTSVNKREQNLSDSAAAVFVISNEDLRRSGVTSIADALRMVPGMNVARIDSNKWAVNCRGGASRFNDKLLVLIDGRSVYTSSFSGVYWEVQDVMLEDVERIEVIRGPGASIWGANAVNGVINIITKHTADTQGGLVSMGGGTEEQGFVSARYGASLKEGTYGRLYAKGFKRDQFVTRTGDDAGDDWGMLRSGFRLDSRAGATDSFTVQGDMYQGGIDQRIDLQSTAAPYSLAVEDDVTVSGGNLLARWQKTLSRTSEFEVQAYYDRTVRKETWEEEERDSFDLSFQHHLKRGRHDIVWGGRFYHTHDDFTDSSVLVIDPASSSDALYSLFFQDEIEISPKRVWLTLGSKFEHNDYSGYEVQPTARLLWAPHRGHRLWTAISRATRTPSRVEQDGTLLNAVVPPGPSPLPVAVTVAGNPGFDTEELTAYELGYRFMASRKFSADITAFYHDYDNLRRTYLENTVFRGTYLEQILRFTNTFSARTSGAEMSGTWQAVDWLKFDLAYTYLDSDMEEGEMVGEEPTHTVSLRTAVNLRKDLDLDIWVRYVDGVDRIYVTDPYPIDAYMTLDLRLAWRPVAGVELAVVGQDLLNGDHLEFVQENFTRPTEIERRVYGTVTYRF
ncbi:MAG: TonB-dependent receptor [Deltaproteobacteria bacterium]|nr:TonB-dependent receptor [Deltaproteobacteria bacterium]